MSLSVLTNPAIGFPTVETPKRKGRKMVWVALIALVALIAWYAWCEWYWRAPPIQVRIAPAAIEPPRVEPAAPVIDATEAARRTREARERGAANPVIIAAGEIERLETRILAAADGGETECVSIILRDDVRVLVSEFFVSRGFGVRTRGDFLTVSWGIGNVP